MQARAAGRSTAATAQIRRRSLPALRSAQRGVRLIAVSIRSTYLVRCLFGAPTCCCCCCGGEVVAAVATES